MIRRNGIRFHIWYEFNLITYSRAALMLRTLKCVLKLALSQKVMVKILKNYSLRTT